jgi:Cu2+-exporting ATPase
MAIETIVLKVSGDRLMRCEGCQNAVQSALNRVPGVLSAEASHRTQDIRVSYDPGRTSPGDMKAALLRAGYRANEASQ